MQSLNTISGRLTISMVGVALVTAVVIAFAVDRSIRASLAPVELERQGDMVTRLTTELGETAMGVREDVLVASQAVPVRDLMEAASSGREPRSHEREQVVRAFAAELRAKAQYLQLRAIGTARSGREIVRVERTRYGGPVRVVPEPELQAKGTRGYFKETLRLGAGEVYISPIELNREHGAVEQPPVPVLRAAISVRGADGDPVGIVVINLDLRKAFERLRKAQVAGLITCLADERGNYLLHPDRQREFAFEFGRRARLQDEFPMLEPALASGSTTVVDEMERGGQSFVLAAAPVVLANGPRVFAISMTPSSRVATARGVRRATLLVALLAAALAGLTAFLLARSVTRPLAAMTARAQKFPEEGDFTPPKGGGSEVTILAHALEQMKRTIRERTTALEQQEATFRVVVEASPSALVMVDDEHRIALVNSKAEELFGYDRSQLLGRTIETLVPQRFRDRHAGYVQGFVENPEARAMGAGRDLFGLRKDGEEIPIEIGLTPLEGPDGVSTLASVIDITERKHRENELRRSNAELEQFAYVASHDLQEPLRMVANYTELLADRYRGRLDEKADKYIHYASDGARRMQTLVTDLLAYSRVGSQGKPLVPVQSGDVLDGVLASLKNQIIDVGASVEHESLPAVLADETQLRQLFQNLIANAIKFRSEAPPKIVVAARPNTHDWIFSVEDNGIGIDLKYADRIFQMFQRLHEIGKYPGSGIGLAIAKRIVERHEGRIWVEAELGRGTTFFFTLRGVPRGQA